MLWHATTNENARRMAQLDSRLLRELNRTDVTKRKKIKISTLLSSRRVKQMKASEAELHESLERLNKLGAHMDQTTKHYGRRKLTLRIRAN